MREDGTLDIEGTLGKTSEAYKALSSQLGAAGGPPPKAPGDYVIKPPADFPAEFQPEDAGVQQFLTAAHKAGFSQRQIDVAMGAFFEWAPKLSAAMLQTDQEACIAAMEKVWADPAERTNNYAAANRALRAFGGERAAIIEAKFGNDPDGVWLLAQIGAQMREDSPASDGSQPAPGMGGMTDEQLVTAMGNRDKGISEPAAKEFQRRALQRAMARRG